MATPPGELDWGQKLAVRRALRVMGAGTRLNVLLANVSENHTSVQPTSYTDLDVFGMQVLPDFRLAYTLAYCTTSAIGTDRVLWLRGLRDEFEGATAILVAREIPRSARELATRSHIVPFTEPELEVWLATHTPRVGDARRAFEAALEPAVGRYHAALRTLPRAFDQLVGFRDYLFLQFGPARALQLTIGYLKSAQGQWHAKEPLHLALLLDIAQLYATALLACARHVLENAIDRELDGVENFVGGGILGRREKQNFARLLTDLLDELERGGVHITPGMRETIRPLPHYTKDLALLTRQLLDAPELAQRLPWYFETLQLAALQRTQDLAGRLVDAGDPEMSVERALRLAREVLSFLVREAGLDRGFLDAFDQMLAPPLLPLGAS